MVVRTSVSVTLALALAFAAPAALAADTSAFGNRDMNADVDLSTAYRLPAALATNLSASRNDGVLTGSFTMINSEDAALGGLRYHMEIWGTGTLDGMLFARETSDASVTLAAGKSTDLSFTMSEPSLPQGEYVLRAQVVTDMGRSLGWTDTPLTVTANAAAFVHAAPAAVVLPEYRNEAFDPMSGPNVSPDGAVTLRTVVENKGKTAMTLVPVLRLSHFDQARGLLSSTTYPTITLQAGEVKTVDLPVNAAQKAEVYAGTVSFLDNATGKTASSLSEFRWIVRGADADTLPVRTVNLGTKKDDVSIFELAFVGAPDAETVTEATATVQVIDRMGTAGELTLPAMQLTDAIVSGTADVTMNRDLKGDASVRVLIRDSAGTVLDDHREDIAASAGTRFPTSTVLLSLIVAAAAGLTAQGLRMKKTWNGTVTGTLAGSAAALLLLVQALPAFAAGNGNGIEVVTPAAGSAWHGHSAPAVVALYISAPAHDAAAGTYSKASVPLQYKVTFGVCENRISHVKVIGRFDANGGKQTTLEGSNANWQTVHTADYQAGPTCAGSYMQQNPQGVEVCLFDRTFNGTVNLSGLASNACSTTLQLIAKLGQSGLDTNNAQPGPPNDSLLRSDASFQAGQVHAVNLWLNFCANVTPQCSDQQDNDGDGVVDAHDIGCYTNGVYNPNDNDESNPASSSSSSSNLPQCSDNVDNDWDGMRDMADPGCWTNGVYNPNDNDEYSTPSSQPPLTQCNDGLDNDWDGATDMSDFSCSNPDDNDETNPKAQCQDGYDNDGDGFTDYPQDPGCTSKQDNDEWNGGNSSSSSRAAQCMDGYDNDGDGRTDYPSDQGCSGWNDDDEWNASSSSSSYDGGFHLRKRAASTEVFPGDEVEYSLEIRNDTGRDIYDVIVRDRFDDRDLMVIDDGGADDERYGEMMWRIGTLRDGDRETIRYRLRLRDGVRPGERVRNDAWAEGSGVSDQDSITVSVIGSLPQTGFLSRADGSSKLVSVGSEHEESPLAAMLSLAMAGLAGGTYLGKRFFLI